MSEPIFENKQQGLLRTKVEKGEGTIPLDRNDGIQTIDGIRRGQRLKTASCSDKLMKWNVLGESGKILFYLIDYCLLCVYCSVNMHVYYHMKSLNKRINNDNSNYKNGHGSSFKVIMVLL